MQLPQTQKHMQCYKDILNLHYNQFSKWICAGSLKNKQQSMIYQGTFVLYSIIEMV